MKNKTAHTAYWRGFVTGWMIAAGIALIMAARYAMETAERSGAAQDELEDL